MAKKEKEGKEKRRKKERKIGRDIGDVRGKDYYKRRVFVASFLNRYNYSLADPADFFPIFFPFSR